MPKLLLLGTGGIAGHHIAEFAEIPECWIVGCVDRVPGRAIIVSVLDNLVKGASGQAVQNMNLVLGYPEDMGLEQIALFP